MNLNVNNVSFGRWSSSTYSDVLSKIQQDAAKYKVDYKETPIYMAFENLHNNTSRGKLVFDKYGRVHDENGVYPYFPKDRKNPKSMFRNIMAASDYLESHGGSTEAEEDGFIDSGRRSGFYA